MADGFAVLVLVLTVEVDFFVVATVLVEAGFLAELVVLTGFLAVDFSLVLAFAGCLVATADAFVADDFTAFDSVLATVGFAIATAFALVVVGDWGLDLVATAGLACGLASATTAFSLILDVVADFLTSAPTNDLALVALGKTPFNAIASIKTFV